jgi:hypothetical protein
MVADHVNYTPMPSVINEILWPCGRSYAKNVDNCRSADSEGHHSGIYVKNVHWSPAMRDSESGGGDRQRRGKD